MAAHAPLPASGSPQWGRCSGSVRAQAGMADAETQQSREGTAAHWVGTECLLRAKLCAQLCAPYGRDCYDWLGATAPNGVLIDQKMVEGAQQLVDDVLAVAEKYNMVSLLLIEQRVHMPQVHTDNWGTFDVALYLPHLRYLFLWDYKHGHREVNVVGDFQFADYALGLVNHLQIDGLTEQGTTLVARVVQPYCYTAQGTVRDWVGPLPDLRPIWNHLAAMAHEVYTNPRLSAGVWCRDCSAVGRCSAARKANYRAIDVVNEPYELDDMTGEELAVERQMLRDALPAMKARIEAIEDDLTNRIARGESDSGLALETTEGRREWTRPPAEIKALALQLGLDASRDAVKTPTQLRDSAPKELRPALSQLYQTLTRRAAGSLKLVTAGESKTARAFKRK